MLHRHCWDGKSQSVEVNQVGLLDRCLTSQQDAVVSQSVKVNQVCWIVAERPSRVLLCLSLLR